MASCPDCGADVQFAFAGHGRIRVRLDTIAEMSGPDRYRLLPGADEAQAIHERYRVPAFPLHDRTCPAMQRTP